MDKEKVLDIAKEYGANLVMSGCVDQANITACYVSEKLGLYTPYSYETALNITNKSYMKKKMLEAGIRTSRYYEIKSMEDISKVDLEFPVMVKPTDSNSSNGVKKAVNEQEMKNYIINALGISRSKKAIVEEYVEGREFNAYCYISDNKANVFATNERMSVIEGKDDVIKCYGAISPARITLEAKQEAKKVATEIANAFKLNNVFMFFQSIVTDKGINVIEFAPRLGGGAGYKTIGILKEINIVDDLINVALGQSVNIERLVGNDDECAVAVGTMYARDCVLERIEGYSNLLKEKKIEDFIIYKTKDAVISNVSASASRVGAFIVKDRNEEELLEKIKYAYERIYVYDKNGNDVLRRDLNLYEKRGSY